MVSLLAAAILLASGGNDLDEIWGEAILESAEVFTAPDPRSYVTGVLRSGDRVRVSARAGDGFLSILPPGDAFDWIPEDALEIRDGRIGTVTAADVMVRSGCDEAKLPGPPALRLARGAIVLLLDRPPITLNHAGGPRTWRAISPLEEDRRYVLASDLRRVAPGESAPPARGKVQNVSQPAAVPDARIDDPEALRREFRGVLAQPLENRDFRNLIERAESSLRAAKAPETRGALEVLLGELGIQERVASAARRFHSAVAKTRKVDRGISNRAIDPFAPRPRHDETGLLGPSDKQLNGIKVYVLYSNETGKVLAYLQLPPGINADGLVGRVVGVDGTFSYSESLGARVMEVRDVEAID
jgi:hypothetical protein